MMLPTSAVSWRRPVFLQHSDDAWHWTQDSYPADAAGLRSVASDNFVMVDVTDEANVIAEEFLFPPP